MRHYLIAAVAALAPVAAQAADCPADMSALKPHLAYPMQDYALPPLKLSPEFLDAMAEAVKDGKTDIEESANHKLTFKGIYAVNDATDVEVKKGIDELNKAIEMERIYRCRAGK